MGNESLQVALIKYNKKTWCKSGLLGIFIGLAVIVPGISGSTTAIIFKLYDQFLYAISNIFKKFKQCFIFLLPILLGAIVGVAGGFFAVQKLLELLPFAIVCLFAGLMTGAVPSVNDEIKDKKYDGKRVALLCVGVLLPVLMGATSAILSLRTGSLAGDKFQTIGWWQPILALLFGAFVGLTQVMPGLSASAFLMTVSWFMSLVESVSLTYWLSNPQIFIIYAALGVGFLGGVFGFSKLLTNLLSKHRVGAYTFILGLSIGSIFSIFCNGDILETYLAWQGAKTGAIILSVALGVALFAIGVVAAYLLVRFERKKSKEAEEIPASTQQ